MIKANFNAYNTYVTDSLYQWDLNQVLSVSGLNLAVVPEVHFSNANMDRAIVRQATKVNNIVSVPIPNSLLQDPLTIYAHIGVYEGNTFKVVEKVEIPIIARKRPADYQIQGADEEIYSFEALKNAIANMVTHNEANAISARIDNIIAHNNDTEGNTELADTRLGFDGVVHGSAGSAVREQIKQIGGLHSSNVVFYQGSIASVDGSNTENVMNRIRTGFFLAENFESAEINEGFIIALFQYDENFSYISTSGWLTANRGINKGMLEPTCRYIRIVIAFASAADISVTENTGFSLKTTSGLHTEKIDVIEKYFTPNIVFESGTLSATTGEETANASRIRTGYLPAAFDKTSIGSGFYFNLFQYDEDYKFLSSSDFVTDITPSMLLERAVYIRFVVRKIGQEDIEPTVESGFSLYRVNNTLAETEAKIDDTRRSFHAYKFNSEIMNTAYSTIGLAPINTAEHYQLAAHLGFNSLKGDVRITADNELIMCHDAGFTLDAEGRITAYDSSNCIDIVDESYSGLMALEYAADYATMGHYAKVCDFDTFIRICKENGKIAYITLRENKIENLVRAVMNVLKKYRMENHCVINSYTLATLREVRKYTDMIPLSQVISLGKVLDTTTVDNAISLKNAMVTMFLYPTDNPLELWTQSAGALEYARDNGVQIHMAQVKSYADYSAMIQRGVQGFHILKAFLPYNRTDVQFSITVENGKAWVNVNGSDRIIADLSKNGGSVTISNIRCNGSGYGYDDGLPALWLRKLPYSVNVMCASNATCSVRVDNGVLILETDDVDGTYYINVNI